MIDECEPAKRLAIAIPAYRGWVSVETSRGLNGVQLLLHKHGIEVDFYYLKKNPYLEHSRNVLVTLALQTSMTDLLFLDDDVGCQPEAFLRIAQARKPFVGGLYPLKTEDGSPGWPGSALPDDVRVGDDGLVEYLIAPTGFLRLNRSVFETLPYKEYNDGSGGPWREYFKCGAFNGWYVGEDPYLCAQWRGMGGKVYVMPDIEFTHTGDQVWRGNFGAWARAVGILKSP